MRLKQAGVARQKAPFTFTHDGCVIEAYPGESIAAALLSANRPLCRETRSGEARGVFCGMGICGECTVLVDGRPRRACMEPAAAGINVTRQPALRALPIEDTPALERGVAPASEAPNESPDIAVDVLVIGAGPAGLAAARSAARCGAKVRVVDERSKAGGQYYKQPGHGFSVDEAQIDSQFREGLALYRSAVDAGVAFSFGTTVWGAFPGPKVAISVRGRHQVISPRRIIVSPGAYERPLPFPGWTLPGVMTTGAAQTLLRAYQTSPGKRVLVAGNGPLNLQVARELDAAGAEVVAVVELARAPALRNAADVLAMCLTSPGLVRDGASHLLRLKRSRVPVIHGHVVTRATGSDRVARVSIARVNTNGEIQAGTDRQFNVDALCLGYGFLAQSEIARALGSGHDSGAHAGVQEIERDGNGRSLHTPEVFIVGDARGLGGARVAAAQGALAGGEAAKDLGFHWSHTQAKDLGLDRRRLQRHRRFQRALWSVYAAPSIDLQLASADTIICRCESATRADIEAVIASGVSSIGAVKRETRAGMGRCQGRYCTRLVVGLLDASCGAVKQGTVVEEQVYFAPRPPFKPLSIDELAAPYDPSATFDRSSGARAPVVKDPAARESELP